MVLYRLRGDDTVIFGGRENGREEVPFEEYDVKLFEEGEEGMSDSAFQTGAYPGFTLAELEAKVDRAEVNGQTAPAAMVAEIARRKRVRAGDRSVMTPGERLRTARAASADKVDGFDRDDLGESPDY